MGEIRLVPPTPVQLMLTYILPICMVREWIGGENKSGRTLTLKHQETHGCVVSTVATDALVLKHQVISILNAD